MDPEIKQSAGGTRGCPDERWNGLPEAGWGLSSSAKHRTELFSLTSPPFFSSPSDMQPLLRGYVLSLVTGTLNSPQYQAIGKVPAAMPSTLPERERDLLLRDPNASDNRG